MTDLKPTNGNCKKCGRPDLATRIPFDDTPDDAFCMCPPEQVQTFSEFSGKYHQEKKPSEIINVRADALRGSKSNQRWWKHNIKGIDELLQTTQAILEYLDSQAHDA